MAHLQPSYEDSKDIPEGYETAFEEKEGKHIFVGGEFEFKTETELEEMRVKKQKFADDFHTLNTSVKGIDIEGYSGMVDELDTLRATVKSGGSDEDTIKAIVDMKVKRATEDLTEERDVLKNENQELLGFKSGVNKSKAINSILKKHDKFSGN